MLTETYVYLISDGTGHYKIGESSNPKGRLMDLQSANARRLHLVAQSDPSPLWHHLEQRIHWEFRDQRVLGEWFKFNDCEAYCAAMAVMVGPEDSSMRWDLRLR